MRDRIEGCLIGSAIGDGFGFPTEFLKVNEIKKKWGEKGLTKPLDGIIKVTDDTQMAISVANAIMKSFKANDIDQEIFGKEIVKEFIIWLNDEENNRAPGMTCLESCEKLAKGLSWQEATSRNSKGCGANMRVTPVALLRFKSDNISKERIAQIAQFQSAITHGHPTALTASELTAIAIVKIIEGTKNDELIDELIRHAEQQLNEYHESWLGNVWERPGILSSKDYVNRGWNDCIGVLKNVKIKLKSYDYITDPCELTGEGWIAEESFGTALFCYLASPENTVEVLIRAVNTKGDSDSIACLAGAFAGAKNGINSIPQDWIKRLEYKDKLNEYLNFILD